MADNFTPTATAITFLKGIKTRNTDQMRAVCHPGGTACLIRDGKPMYITLDDILDRVCKDDGVERDEVSYDEIEHVDGDFATVWTPYRFYEDGKLHHGGSNSFTLWNSPDKGWLITAVQDVARYLEGVTAIDWRQDKSMG